MLSRRRKRKMSDKKTTFSIEQNNAINAIGENYLISAGAGSGKTAVLTERIFQIAKKDKSLDKFLVLTFTNLAAGEMKDRVRRKLLDDPETLYLASEVDNAHIETFDSFSLFIVKKYFYELGISKDLSIFDNSILQIKRKIFLEEIIQEHLASHDQEFEDLVLAFSTKNLNKIKDYVIDILEECDKKGNKSAYFNHFKNDFFNQKFVEQAIDDYKNEIHSNIKYLQSTSPSKASS